MDNSIDIISNIALNGISKKAARTAGADNGKDDTDTMIRSDFAALLDKAIAAPDVNQTAVTQAKAAIRIGTLDTPQNIQHAVTNMLTYGV